jgi:hypothetical protein
MFCNSCQEHPNLHPVCKTSALARIRSHSHGRSHSDAFLKHMGWHQHQAVYPAHSDTVHPRLHIILNRVHPDTGRTLNDWQERKRAQAWAPRL